MNELLTIGNTQFAAKTLDGKPVLTFRDIDAIHHRPEGSARKRFNDNRQRFVEGEDYFKITPSEFLMIVKSFTDDWAWEVQRKLVKTYFRAKELAAEKPKPMTPNEMFAMQAQINLDYEKKLTALEGKLENTNKKFDTVANFMTAPYAEGDAWKDRTAKRIKQAVEEFGLNYQTFHKELYDELERTAGVDLQCRQTRRRNRMWEAGATKTECKGVSKLSIVADDKKLRAMFETILRNHVVQLAASRGR